MPKKITRREIANLLTGTREKVRGQRPQPTPLALIAAHVGVSLGTLGERLGVSRGLGVMWATRGVPPSHVGALRKLVAKGKCIKARVPWDAVIAQAAKAA